MLYLRGDREGGSIGEYVDGFRVAGLTDIRSSLIPHSGHYSPEEAPSEVWGAIRRFIDATAVETP